MMTALLPIFTAIAIGMAALIIEVLVDDDGYGDDDE